ncbi:microtubule-associated tumor suppressor candidate 2 isoform X1 [Gadus macrocephalus]|uniref:microtubule-associated tumor suppressor candidate 2 isoform X1 n=1 Tax=Gadus macrocephalus TaxID=80720 RepID=UPI0028CB92E7|nr:microtubule-associated tumor suppressor candidate 2 isoform X1 [Gadus macrocephalus]
MSEERGDPVVKGEGKNNNGHAVLVADDDSNANDIPAEGGGDGATVDAGTLSILTTDTGPQDKVVIWGTESQCDDPELAEFEMLECQELEAFLVEDGEDFQGLTEQKSRPLVETKLGDTEHKAERRSGGHGPKEHGANTSGPDMAECFTRTDLSSENELFVSCMSSLGGSLASALDTSGRTTGPYRTFSEDLTLSSSAISDRVKVPPLKPNRHASTPMISTTLNRRDVNMNRNSTSVLSEDLILEAQQINNKVPPGKQHNPGTEEHRGNLNLRHRGDKNHDGFNGLADQHEVNNKKKDQSTQADEVPDMNDNPQYSIEPVSKQALFDKSVNKQKSFDRTLNKQPSFESTLKKQGSFDNSFKKQGSFENSHAFSLERRKPWGSPSRPVSPIPSKITSSPKRKDPGSPAKVGRTRAPSQERSESPLRSTTSVKPPAKAGLNSGIPKPIANPPQKESDHRMSSPPKKPQTIRPKIITYVRKSPPTKPEGTDVPSEVSAHPSPSVGGKEHIQGKGAAVLCSSNQLFDKYRQEMQRAGHCPAGPGETSSGRPSSSPHKGSRKQENFHSEPSNKYLQEHPAETGGMFRSPRTMKPQLGIGAVARQQPAKTKAPFKVQRPAGGPGHEDPSGETRKPGHTHESLATPTGPLLRAGQSGLRPPGYSALPPARRASFGFARSGSPSSVSSNQSGASDLCQPHQHPSRGGDEASLHRVTAPPSGPRENSPHPHSSSPSPGSTPALQRRTATPPRGSPARGSPQASRKELHSSPATPKHLAMVSPKPQSPARGQSPAAGHAGPRDEGVRESERALVQQLRSLCQDQAQQVQYLQAQLRKASLGLEVFAITTQHFCQKSESAIEKQRELSLELAKIRDEVAVSVARWEHLQRDKEELERRFRSELRGLRSRQQGELVALEERLRARHAEESLRLREEQQQEMEELRASQEEQIDDMSESHEASLMEMEKTHNDTLVTLREENTRTVKNLKMAHEQQRKSLEEDFEKLRLSLQDQVDTLTFQNRSLRDRAKRFEEALRRSTDEQIVEALAPYQHIEEDLKSLKEVLEMKNQQIHQQEVKISELEIMQAEKNVYLEERVQVLQQQNEDLKARIDKNVATSRQLSAENANLQVHVEQESKEKKRLSRNNEELLWRLQTGELSPHMSPSSSPIHQTFSNPGSPARPHSYHQ